MPYRDPSDAGYDAWKTTKPLPDWEYLGMAGACDQCETVVEDLVQPRDGVGRYCEDCIEDVIDNMRRDRRG